MVELIAEVGGAGIEPEYLGTGNPDGEIDRQYVDSTKLRELTGWRPAVELRRRPAPHPRLVPRAPRGPPRKGFCVAMCGRFTVTAKDTKKIADRFQVELEKALERNAAARRRRRRPSGRRRWRKALGRFNVAPTQEILTVRSSPDPEEAAQGEREARLMRWGLVPRWAKDLKVGYRMINAKAENLTSSRAYAPLVGKFRHRCLIVADGFYEWMKAEDPKQPRQPWRFTVDGGEPFAFAGICTRKEWEDPEDRGFDDGWLYSCTIVTTTPNELVAKVHDRMPAILPERRGRGRLASSRPRARGRGGDVRAAARGADGERPGQPEAEQGRQGQRGRPGAAGRPARRELLHFLRPADRLRCSARCEGACGVRRVALPALVVERAGDPWRAGVDGRPPDRGEGEHQVLARPPGRQEPYSPACLADPEWAPIRA